MELNKHELYEALLSEIEMANDVFMDAVQNLHDSHIRNIKDILRTHLSIEEGSTETLLAQSIREQLENPITVVTPVAEETEETTEDTKSLAALIANQVSETTDEPVEERRVPRRPISLIIQELKNSVEHTIEEETDVATEEIISEKLSASEGNEDATVTDLADKIKAELLAQQIKKQLQ